tara:strand:- start:1359 stop:3212 length:1854 start_codon:yes stop_codon:yes gene_type:complete
MREMEKITINSPEAKSLDIKQQNIEQLKLIFPNIFSDNKIDFEALKAVLGEEIDDSEERYNFTWNGKAKARQIAQTPSTGTLRPSKEESVNWDTTENLYIEGDNLEVLKVLQKSYHKSVDMIFIDPPYNTGRDFIYSDNYNDSIKNYLVLSEQVDSKGNLKSTNSDSSGRYHTNWLNMMYPRLILAKKILSNEGVIFISIDDTEVTNLKKVCDEVFGEINFITTIAWQKKVSPANDAKWFSSDHDHILVYAKNKSEWRPTRLEMNEKQRGYYTNPDNDSRGDWNSATYTCNKNKEERPNLYYPLINPNTGKEVWPKETAVWAYSRKMSEEHIADNLIYWGKDGKSSSPRLKKFITESKGIVPRTVWLYNDVGHTQEATKDLLRDLPDCPFDTPKPIRLIKHMINIGASKKDALILDFFGGSSSTACAVLEKNQEDGGKRKFIIVQLPEPISNQKYKTISNIGKERIKAFMARLNINTLESGYKTLKLDETNIYPWDADFDNLEQILRQATESIKTDRSNEDVLYEILLKYGIELTVPIETEIVNGKQVFVVGAGALIVCLDDGITSEVVEGIAKLKDKLDPETTQVVFKDAGFADSNVKTNAIQILKQAGVDDVKSI